MDLIFSNTSDTLLNLNRLFLTAIRIDNIRMFEFLLKYVNKSDLNWNILIQETNTPTKFYS